jgi:hypothetical protein
MIAGDDRVGPASERSNPLDLSQPDDHVGDQDVAHATGGHDFGFRNFGTRHANRAGFNFFQGDGGRLVTFLVGTPLHTALAAVARHLVDVRFHPIEVDAQDRRVEFVFADTDERLRHGKDPFANYLGIQEMVSTR